MKTLEVSCRCGEVTLRLSGEPIVQAYCHCEDCQAAHGAAYVLTAAYPAAAVTVLNGQLSTLVIKTAQRVRCASCGTPLFTEVVAAPLRSVNAYLLPKVEFKPQMHVQCQYAVLPVVDHLPHFKDFPAVAGGSGELVDW